MEDKVCYGGKSEVDCRKPDAPLGQILQMHHIIVDEFTWHEEGQVQQEGTYSIY